MACCGEAPPALETIGGTARSTIAKVGEVVAGLEVDVVATEGAVRIEHIVAGTFAHVVTTPARVSSATERSLPGPPSNVEVLQGAAEIMSAPHRRRA